ncbi:MAG TPA: DEAD/DEAH box helicase [Polyangiaceae bacterium]|nr:DEAD/DEAH box helicase [Polyangiaceae bacterium]
MPLPHQFHPAVRAWFDRRFDGPTPAQSRGWAEILAGHDTLIAAPTGSGKTLAAFLASVDALVRRHADRHAAGASGAQPQGDLIEVVYVSPLKALSSDVERNLVAPLEGIADAARELGLPPPGIRVALRTGDTTPAARAAILRHVPHMLITTPESLYLMLTAERSRALLRGVRTVIVDEVHALMRDKRGSHLALSLARLDAVAETRPQRIGLSATVHPIEEAARFLVGQGRPCAVVDVGHRRDLDLKIEVPGTDLQAVATHEQWSEIYDRLAALIAEHRTTLIFVNTRRMAERVAHHLGERLGEDRVGAHHGSLAKDRRLRIEQRLKAGEMRALAATASLELGIDVGSVDLVCQIGSPRAVTTMLQRIGRSGHALGRTSRGRLFATSRDELVECAALVRAIAGGRLDRIDPPRAPLDVLAQQIVAECAAREWTEDALFAQFRQATPFAELERREFDDVVASVSEGAAPRLGRGGALVHRDRVNRVLRGRRAARIVALTNGGAIPDLADYRVVLDPDETLVGTVNEDWAIESMAGDVFVLGSHSWRIRRVESRSGVMRVEDAQGQPPTVPFWLGEAPSRTWELSVEVSRLRADTIERVDLGPGAPEWLQGECGLARAAAEQLAAYIGAQRDALGVVPTMDDIVFERFFDEAGGMQLVVHAPFGGRVNRAFGLALRKRFCVSFDFELQAAATDDAIVLSIGTSQSFPLSDAFHFVRANQLDATLEQAILAAPMFGTRWRWNASRALAILRTERGKKVPPFLQRMRSDDLLAAVFPAQTACQENVRGPLEIPDHPLVRQTLRDCLHEAMDTDRLRGLLERMERGEIRLHARDVTEPSPFSHEVLNAKPYAFLDDAPLEERRARAVSLRRTLPEHQRDLGALDRDAIERVIAEARPAPRDADELHDVLLGLVAAPIEDAWTGWLSDLVRAGRAHRVRPGSSLAFATERARTIEVLYPDAPRVDLPGPLDGPRPSREEAVLAVVRGHAEVAGPFTASLFAARLELEPWEVASAAAQLESEGLVLRGRFEGGSTDGRESGHDLRSGGTEEEQFCDRRLLARIHRQTIDRLRAEIEPVSAQDLLRYLFERHHLGSRTRAGGRAGLRDALGMLAGFEIGAAAWERDVLAPRVAGYRAEWLDELCLAGEVAWGRLSPRRANVGSTAMGSTSRATPIALAARRDLGWLLAAVRGSDARSTSPEPPMSEGPKAALEALGRRGALFLDDLAAAARLSRTETIDALWDLVGRGLVTADGYGPLRELMAGGRAARGRRSGGQGRWSLFDGGEPEGAPPLTDEIADRVAQQLLARYGVVFREVVARESFSVPWRDVARALRRREARGLVRGGRFVSGFMGEQYALPEAVDALRRVRRTARTGEVVTLSAADPLNLVGIVTPGPRIPSNQGSPITFVDGAVVESERPAPSADTTTPIAV